MKKGGKDGGLTSLKDGRDELNEWKKIYRMGRGVVVSCIKGMNMKVRWGRSFHKRAK